VTSLIPFVDDLGVAYDARRLFSPSGKENIDVPTGEILDKNHLPHVKWRLLFSCTREEN
jgi:hypothetical protein